MSSHELPRDEQVEAGAAVLCACAWLSELYDSFNAAPENRVHPIPTNPQVIRAAYAAVKSVVRSMPEDLREAAVERGVDLVKESPFALGTLGTPKSGMVS